MLTAWKNLALLNQLCFIAFSLLTVFLGVLSLVTHDFGRFGFGVLALLSAFYAVMTWFVTIVE